MSRRTFLGSETLGKSAIVKNRLDLATDLADRALGVPNRIRYRFDNALSSGTGPVLILLGLATFLVVFVAAVLITLFNAVFVPGESGRFVELFWQTGLRALDPGTMAGDEGWPVRLLSLFVTLSGILIAGTLIGAIATGLETRLEDLRKGKSLVAETDHILILGWTDRGFVVLDQLALVNSMKETASAIVILAERSKVDLEDDIRNRVNSHGSRFVVRNGNPSNPIDLARVNVRGARSVVVLGDEEPGDAQVITTILAVSARRDDLSRIPIVADLTEPDTPAAIEQGFRGRVNTVMASRIVARLAAFSLREPGMSQVMLELMNFAGSEIYIRSIPGSQDATYSEVINGFERACAVGVSKADGSVELNPPPEYRFGPEDRVVVIAPNERALAFNRAQQIGRRSNLRIEPKHNRLEHVLVIGWSALGDSMLEELDKFVSPNSSATIMFNERILDPTDVEAPETLNLNVTILPTRDQPGEVARIIAERPLTSIVILAYRGQINSTRADARSLLSLLLTREALRTSPWSKPSVVVELLESSNVELAAISGADDYVVSDALASQVVSQLAENPERQAVFEHLYAPKRASVVFPTAEFLGLGGEVSFGDITKATFAAGASAVGFRRTSQGDLDVQLNPPKSQIIHLDLRDEIVAIV